MSDDGLPYPGNLSVGWTQLSGPTPATFTDVSDPETAVEFTEIGTYVFQLSADDNEDVVNDTVTVIVTAPQRGPMMD